jgi:uncharacterized integral membrane protein
MTIEPERTDKISPPAAPAAPEPSPAPDPPVPDSPPAPILPQHKIKRTRISSTWVAITCFAVVLLLLLIFILQNGRTVEVSYFGAHGHLPLGAALLLAAVAGVLLVALPSSARMVQLRITALRHRRDDARYHLAGHPEDPPGTPTNGA